MKILSKTLLWISLIGSSVLLLAYIGFAGFIAWLAVSGSLTVFGMGDALGSGELGVIDIFWIGAFPALLAISYLTREEVEIGRLFKIAAATNAAHLFVAISLSF